MLKYTEEEILSSEIKRVDFIQPNLWRIITKTPIDVIIVKFIGRVDDTDEEIKVKLYNEMSKIEEVEPIVNNNNETRVELLDSKPIQPNN